MQKHLLLIILIMILPACATLQSNQALWSADLPAQEYFVNEFQRDTVNHQQQTLDQYLTWVTRFYEGTELYPKGWNHITQALLLRITEAEQANEVKDKMQRLGLLISGEWAKNNQTRLINTRHVSIWGNALIKSLEQGETLELLARVSADVDDLLAQRLAADAITEGRFYAEEDVLDYIN
jgi:hypothetical protein